jgi:hypothetical protein
MILYDCLGILNDIDLSDIYPILRHIPTWLQQPRCRRGRFRPVLRLAPCPAQATESLQVGVAQRYLMDGWIADQQNDWDIVGYCGIFWDIVGMSTLRTAPPV